LLDVDQMTIYFLASIVLFLFLLVFVFFLLDVTFIDFYDLSVPILGVYCVDEHEYLSAQFIVNSLLVL
jgi:hypothetical protein